MAFVWRRTMLAAMAALSISWPDATPRPELSVMTWNVCAGTNPACGLYRASAEKLGQDIAQYAVDQPIEPDVIFLQEFCTEATSALRLWLDRRTGRRWSIRSWGLTSKDGTPYPCRPDRLGRSRGAQSVTVAVADDAVTFRSLPLAAPPWYVQRAVVCAMIPARRVQVCGTHLSSGGSYDDREPGAPYRTEQIKKLVAYAAEPGYRTVFGGDLNVDPQGSPAGRRAIAPAYEAYQECEQHGTGQAGRSTFGGGSRWTYSGGAGRRKLDYLFAPMGTVLQCRTGQFSALSDHRPLYIRLAL